MDTISTSLNDILSDITFKTPNQLDNKVTLCLNMIVKNESRIITRLLSTVLPIIDTYVICDTGSTDDTPQIITNFFKEHNIPGEVITEPFKNFGYNRTVALKAARGKATYALLLDADMRLKIEPSFNKQLLTAGAYLIAQKGGDLSYHNVRLIRLDIDAKCVCPTHEYYDLPPGTDSQKLDTLWIDDIGDGGCKSDKFERDIRLLTQGIEEEPNNGRYYFYLANSYFNCGRHIESIPYYKRRIELGGWYEEVFYAHLNLGHAYMTNKQPEMAISTWMEAYNLHPKRSETIYQICKYYREKVGKNNIAKVFCDLGRSIPYPIHDNLFIHRDVYDYQLDYELTIIGYYTGVKNLDKLSCKLMNKPRAAGIYNNVLSNYKFYTPKLNNYIKSSFNNQNISMNEKMTICGVEYDMRASNPCVFIAPDGSKRISVRFVNYELQHNGCYHFSVNDGKIATVNRIYYLDNSSYQIDNSRPVITLMPENGDLRYVGIEDFKVSRFSLDEPENMMRFVGTCQNPANGKLAMGYGLYNLDSGESALKYSPVETEYNRDCEKNWALYQDVVVYQWYPMQLGHIEQSIGDGGCNDGVSGYKYSKWKEIETPFYFKNVRGSSNGVEVGDEVWFLCHVVEYSTPRCYYHLFVVVDKLSFEIKRYSRLFKFEGVPIEYSVGMIIEEDKIVISYSRWDNNPVIGVYDKERIERELFDFNF